MYSFIRNFELSVHIFSFPQSVRIIEKVLSVIRLNLKRKVIFEKEKYDFATVQCLSSSCKYGAANKHRTNITLFFSTSVLVFRTVAFGLLIVSAFKSVQDLENLTGIPLIKNEVVLLRIHNLTEI